MRRLVLLLSLGLAACSRAPAPGPDPRQIRIAGSAAGLRFTAAVAEDFIRAETEAVAPLVQADGSGTGIARFCEGLGARHPDLIAATRPMTAPERARCRANGVGDIATIQIGWSALVLAARRDAPPLALTRVDLWRALTGPASTWAAIDARLPATAIRVHGPTPRPELADGLFDTMLRPGCVAGGGPCETIAVRRDAAYVPHGADAALIAASVMQAPAGAVGILPYADGVGTLRLLTLDGVPPDPATIASGRYPARLPLLLLIKSAEAGAVPGMPSLLRRIAGALAPGGRFARLGLVPLAPSARDDTIARLHRIAARL